MNREYYKSKLKVANSGSDVYNRGLRDANRVAKIWMNKIFDDFESKSCENCNHYFCESYTNVPSVKINCMLLKGLPIGLESKGFGCSKFERKES